jgi:hypothetical protein
MELTIDGGSPIVDPGAADLERLLRGLRPDQIAVLESAELTFAEAVRFDDTFLLGYQDGTTDRHYEHPGDATIDEVVDVFLAYVRGDEAWRTRVPWQHVVLEPAGDPVPEPRPWPVWARAVRAVALVGGAFAGAACCGGDQGWISGPIVAALVALVLFGMWWSDRR